MRSWWIAQKLSRKWFQKKKTPGPRLYHNRSMSKKLKNVLLLGRKGIVLDDIQKAVAVQDVALFSGTSLDDVRNVFGAHSIDMVIMGAGLDLEVRLEIVKYIFTVSTSTTVHMKDRDSGPQGMLPFVNGVLTGLFG